MISTLYQIFANGNLTREDAVFIMVFFLLTYAALAFAALPIHELAHGVVAYWLGDRTAKMNGRLTLNPLAHLDVFGMLMLTLCGFGFAKPVTVNPMNFRTPRVGMALTALAGPVSNLLLAIGAVAVFRILLFVGTVFSMFEATYTWLPYYYDVLGYVQLFLIDIFATINISLAVFNMIPLPPLDGSRIASLVLPERWFFTLARYERYFTIGLFLLLMSPVLDTPLGIMHELVGFVICAIFGLPNLFAQI